jgi:hypothetical protein
VEGVVSGFEAFEEVELDESRHGIKIGVTGRPHVLEVGFASSGNPESVHGDEHGLHLTKTACLLQLRKSRTVAMVFLPRTRQTADFVSVPIVLRLVIERRFAGSLNKMAMATSPRLIVR